MLINVPYSERATVAVTAVMVVVVALSLRPIRGHLREVPRLFATWTDWPAALAGIALTALFLAMALSLRLGLLSWAVGGSVVTAAWIVLRRPSAVPDRPGSL